MRTILVTGASGAVGRRVIDLLVAEGQFGRIVAVDRLPAKVSAPPESVDVHQVDLRDADLDDVLAGVNCVVHLAEDRSQDANAESAARVMHRLQSAAAEAGVDHFVLLSSALVYGANDDNPVPITETEPVRPSDLAHAKLKAELEEISVEWAKEHGVRLAILRPAVALSEEDASWIGSALRAATTVRPEQVDPPVQFVHHDDLARAVVLVADMQLASVYNVAADGWLGADAFRALRGETEVRLPERAGRLRHRAAKMVANRSLLEGLEPYVTNPWVVANDKLRAEGWRPTFSNEEVYILGTTAPLLATLGPQKRQELALGAVGAVGAAAVGLAAWALRRVTR